MNRAWEKCLTANDLQTMYHLQAPNHNGPHAVSSPTKPFLQLGNDQSRLKRTTCDLCRERKVRCDRGKPECGRCKRVGQQCVYPSSYSESKDLNSVLQSFHSRLSKYAAACVNPQAVVPKKPWSPTHILPVQTEANLMAQAQTVPNSHSRSNSHTRKTIQSQGAFSSVDMDMGSLASCGSESW